MPPYFYDRESMAAATASLSLLEQGVYRALLDAYVNRTSIGLPEEGSSLTEGENLRFLASLIGAKSEAELAAIRKVVMMLFKREGGYLAVLRLQPLVHQKAALVEEEVPRVKGYASEKDPLAIPFGTGDGAPQWWAPTEDLIGRFQAAYRCLDVLDVIVEARLAAMKPGQRPTDEPLGYLEERLQANATKLAERFDALGLPRLALDAPRFVGFVRSYPRQNGLAGAWQVWSLLAIEEDADLCEKIGTGLRRWKKSREWLQLGGESIPTAAHFLTREDWRNHPRLGPAAEGQIAATSVIFPGNTVARGGGSHGN